MTAKTIAAISTPTGVGGIGTIRISGENAIEIADKVFLSASHEKLASVSGYTARYGRVVWNEKTIDDAVALVFRAPHSFTGENVVEITAHGGSFVLKTILRAILEAGAVAAQAGEFTKRAFLNGKMDLSEAEAVMDIISASGDRALRAARATADGAVSREIAVIKADLVFAAATVTAFTDFPDEEPSFSGIDKLPEMLKNSAEKLRKLIRDYDSGKVVKEGVRAAIIGSTNVGKSTLMNLLSRADRSIVTSIAGTTRDVIEETVQIGDVKLLLSDTAGMRETGDEVEKIGVERSKKAMENADLIIFVADASRPFSEDEKEIFDSIKNKTAIAVINKTDIADSDLKLGIKTVKMSAKQGVGLENLEAAILETVGAMELSADAVILSNERQRNCVFEALREIDSAIETLSLGYTIDAVGTCIDSALEHLMELTGESVTSEVADEIFRKFCVGK